ncbi:hypothetical protein GR168_16765 [Gordonia sp. JH63]|uniref:Cyclodehydratase n=1 Tax=Gordonia hongkongensis TaxID=1701090 RepID=A0AAX3T3V7_9ACTN|nr:MULTISPECIES: hypothetical protein [Gordonia]QIK47135.1 hypothetical protein G8C36_07685 [Gordonia terrae]MBN0972903.1 hypothetical protein [Gordonia sp. BP-119]MBN0981946.1 hypothetical protein [Gordonia sp. BP-94]MBR7194918.1 hypothetical protein [Gordonia sp. SCSIO 19800]MDF6101017.1 hypothetical protein [Gordonia hongkongensis]
MSPARTSSSAISVSPCAVPPAVPRLLPGTPVIVQPGNSVRVGIDPADSLLLDFDASVSAYSVAGLLRSLEDPCTADTFARRARRAGLHDDDLDLVLSSLVSAGRAVVDRPPTAAEFHILIHGQGPISEQLSNSLRSMGLSARRTMRRLPDGTLDAVDTDLVILTDFVVHDPRVVFALTRARIPHLLVRVRDGVGIVGPLVLPGLSSCLMCADRHRSDADPDWPALAVQLIRTSGQASPAVVAMTAAMAHSQIEQLVEAVRDRPHVEPRPDPQLLDHVLEFRDDPTRLDIRQWSPHPACDCRPAPDQQARSSIV